MLARVANYLYWMGRYVERAEHLARYLNVNYFSSLDAPESLSQSRSFVLESMTFMFGEKPELLEEKKEEEVLFHLGMDHEFFGSVTNCVIQARENARGSRDMISSEVWEAINKFYHLTLNYPSEVFVKTGLFDFTNQVIENCTVIRGKIVGTLLQDDGLSLVMLGIHLERAFQIARMINTKLNDCIKLTQDGENEIGVQYQWATLLKCAESFDMMRRYTKKAPDRDSTLKFLFFNEKCPRSLVHCLRQVNKYIDRIAPEKHAKPDSLEFQVGRITSEFAYLTYDEVRDNPWEFVSDTLERIGFISKKLEDTYLHY